MKQLFTLILVAAGLFGITSYASADNELTVNLTEAGTLASQIPEDSRASLTKLIVTGPINSTDLRTLREYCGSDSVGDPTDGKVTYLDISGTNIVPGGYYYMSEFGDYYYTTEDDVLPALAFAYCNKLDTLLLPESITAIGDEAFERCDALKHLVIPDKVDTLGWSTFASSGLEDITLSKNINEIPDRCFARCYDLKTVTLNGTPKRLGYMSFSNCRKLESIALNEGVEEIDTAAFINCRAITTFSLPSTITSLKSQAFYNCSNLTSLNSYASFPPKCDADAFSGLDTYNCTLYVPAGTKRIYEIASGFSGFDNIVEMETTGIKDITSDDNAGAACYTIDGRKADEDTKGLVIIRRADGTTSKVIRK